MKTFAAIIVALALFPAVSSAAQVAGTAAARTTAATSMQAAGGHVYVVSGNVFVAQGKKPAHRVTDNEVIVSDTLISTGDKSAALLKFADGQIVTMQANSALHVRQYRYDAKKIENSNVILSMFKGGMRFITGLIGQHQKQAFRLSTPNATIGIRGTEFMVTMSGRSMYSRVLAGKITMTNSAGMTALGAGQSAVTSTSSTLPSLVSASVIPSGTFSELLSIPVDPSAIPASVPAPAPGSVSPPASDAAASMTGEIAGAGEAATVAGASIGVAGGALASMAESGPDLTQAAPQPAVPAAEPQKPVAPAEMSSKPEPEHVAKTEKQATIMKSGKGIAARIGTLGFGAELNMRVSDSVNARFGINAGSHKYNATTGSTSYDFDLQLQSVSALADWYPYQNGFHASGGLLYNNTQDTFSPSASSFTIGSGIYTTSGTGPNVLSSYEATMSFNTISPYIGVGWGNPVEKGKGWAVVTDIGVLFQGEPHIDLVASCATSCPNLQADAVAENAKLQSSLSNYKWWPVVSVGISYQW